MSIPCGNTACDSFGYDHLAYQPCGVLAERPGQACRYCGREVLVDDGPVGCPNCWVPVGEGEQG